MLVYFIILLLFPIINGNNGTFPGFFISLSGFNRHTYDPVTNEGQLKWLGKQVLNMQFKSKTTVEGIPIPDDVEIVPYFVCSQGIESKICSTVNEVREYYQETGSYGGGIEIFEIGFSYEESNSMKKADITINKEKQAMFYMGIMCLAYQMVRNFDKVSLHDEFVQVVIEAPLGDTKYWKKYVFDQFGNSVLGTGGFGSKGTLVSTLKADYQSITHSTQEQMKEVGKANFLGFIKAEAESGSANNYTEHSIFNSTMTSVEYHTVGAPLDPEDRSKWLAASQDHAELIYVGFNSICDLVTSKNFPNLTDVDQQRETCIKAEAEICATIPGCAGPPPAEIPPWGTNEGNVFNSNQVDVAGPQGCGEQSAFGLAQRDHYDAIIGPGNALWLASQNTSLLAINISTGFPWKVLGDNLQNPNLVSFTNNVIALSTTETINLLVDGNLQDPIVLNFTVVDLALSAPTTNNSLVAITPTGAVSFSVDGGEVTIKWIYEKVHKTPVSPSTLNSNNDVIIYDGEVIYALFQDDPSSTEPQVRWAVAMYGDPQIIRSSTNGKMVYCISHPFNTTDYAIYAFDSSIGWFRWAVAGISTVLAVSDMGYVIASDGGSIYSLGYLTGQRQWNYTLGTDNAPISAAVGVDGAIYIMTQVHIYCFAPLDGTVMWLYDLPHSTSGKLLIGHENRLVAIINNSDSTRMVILDGVDGSAQPCGGL